MSDEPPSKPKKGGRQPKPPFKAAKSPKNSWTSPKEIERREKIREALEYRRACHSFTKIAEQMGVSVSTAYNWIIEGMREQVREPGDIVLHMELARIDEMVSGVYEAAVNGDIPSIGAVTRLMERRAKYLGIESPLKVTNTDTEGNYVAPIIGAAAQAPVIQVFFGGRQCDEPPPKPADEKKPEPVG
jgi:hypothetical protein